MVTGVPPEPPEDTSVPPVPPAFIGTPSAVSGTESTSTGVPPVEPDLNSVPLETTSSEIAGASSMLLTVGRGRVT